jgi:hypothetical protein
LKLKSLGALFFHCKGAMNEEEGNQWTHSTWSCDQNLWPIFQATTSGLSGKSYSFESPWLSTKNQRDSLQLAIYTSCSTIHPNNFFFKKKKHREKEEQSLVASSLLYCIRTAFHHQKNLNVNSTTK